MDVDTDADGGSSHGAPKWFMIPTLLALTVVVGGGNFLGYPAPAVFAAGVVTAFAFAAFGVYGPIDPD